MKGTFIGEFEELILLIAGGLNESAYGVAIAKEIAETTGRNPNIGAIHTVLRRLESKGLLSSHLGGATSLRGGRRKRIYKVTQEGHRVLKSIYETRSNLFHKMNPSTS